MTQIIIINDTGAQIAAAATITLDGVNTMPPVDKIRTGALVMMGSAATSLATATTLTETATAPTTGNYVYLNAENSIKLGVAMETWHVLVLDVVLKGDLIRT